MIKNWLYNNLVMRKTVIKEEFQTYRLANPKLRIRAWFLLIKLNIKYCFKKNTDNKKILIDELQFKTLQNKVAVLEASQLKIEKSKVTQHKVTQPKVVEEKRKLPYLEGAESGIYKRPKEIHFARELLNFDVVSFDIFDTLILRPFAKPSDLFMVVGNKLNYIDFMSIRIDAEKEARAISIAMYGHHEITIYDIYEIIERKTGIDKNIGVQAEVEVEVEFCFPNPYMKRVFKLISEQNKNIILTSDMYLPQELMVKLLDKCGYSGYKKLYISCDYLSNKRSGTMFNNILHSLDKDETIIHVGDNYTTDIESAQKFGISTKYYKNVHTIGNQYRADGMSELVGSLYSGIVNTHLHNGTKQYSPYYEFGFTYGGLYILGYCNWIYKKAKKEGIDKVLFLSRDGEIYQKIFNMMFDDMPNEYFYWSRIASLKYSAQYNKKDFIDRMGHKAFSPDKKTIYDVLKTVNIEFLCEKYPEYFKYKGVVFSSEHIKVLEEILHNNWDEIVNSYNKEKLYCLDNITKIIGNSKKVAIIDVGWIGSGARGIREIINNETNLECDIYNWVAASRAKSHAAIINELLSEKLECYIFSRLQNKNLYEVHMNTNKNTNSIYFEIFTQAKYPSFSGFNEHGKFCFDIPEVENYNIIHQIHEGIVDFVENYLRITQNNIYIRNISGSDAYQPYKMIIKNLKFIKSYFKDFSYARGISGIPDKQQIEKLGDIMNQLNI